MTNQVISDIVAAEQKAAGIVENAQIAAREAVLRSQESLKISLEEKITEAKKQAKELVLQKKELLNKQTILIKQQNQTKYQEILRETALKMEDAADLIAERILE